MRNLGLDLLRLLAVVLVLGRHLELPPGANAFLRVWQTGGWIGVDLFFVLSGFLVSGLLFKEYAREGAVDLRRFLIRRGLKIYPAFYVLIAFTVVVNFLAGEEFSAAPVAAELLFVQNYFRGLWLHTWSLAIEEHFYLGLALLVFFLVRRRGPLGGADPFRAVPVVFVALAVACLAGRVANLVRFEEYSHLQFLARTHLRIDSLMFGVLLCYLWHFRGLEARVKKVGSGTLLAGGGLLLAPAFVLPVERFHSVSVFGVVAFYCGAGLLLLAALRWEATASRPVALLGSLGAASYSIYLWHMAVEGYGWRALKKLSGVDSFALYFVFYMVGSLVLGWVMGKLVEWPVVRFRDRVFPSALAPRKR